MTIIHHEDEHRIASGGGRGNLFAGAAGHRSQSRARVTVRHDYRVASLSVMTTSSLLTGRAQPLGLFYSRPRRCSPLGIVAWPGVERVATRLAPLVPNSVKAFGQLRRQASSDLTPSVSTHEPFLSRHHHAAKGKGRVPILPGEIPHFRGERPNVCV